MVNAMTYIDLIYITLNYTSLLQLLTIISAIRLAFSVRAPIRLILHFTLTIGCITVDA